MGKLHPLLKHTNFFNAGIISQEKQYGLEKLGDFLVDTVHLL